MVQPALFAAEFVDADLARHENPIGEVRDDQGDVPSLRDHGVGLVRPALAITARMSVNIRHHLQTEFLAAPPDDIHPAGVEHDHAAQGVRINVVIEDEGLDDPAVAFAATEKKGARLAAARATFLQTVRQLMPRPFLA